MMSMMSSCVIATILSLLLSFGKSTILTSVLSMITTPGNKSCAVVGVGVLGTSLCRQLLQDNWQVTGITKTTSRHEQLYQQLGSTNFHLTVQAKDEKFDHVVFCAPPSGFDDYPAAVGEAAETLWKGPDGGGVFVFTSSGAV